jgi:small subunit ribosomal protein S16
MGRKKKPFYRIVAADQRTARTGGFLEVLGIYDPLLKPHKVEINEERITYWLERGAQPSDTVRSLLKQKGIIYRRELVKKGMEAEKIVEEMRKWEVIQIEKTKRREAVKTPVKKVKAEKTEAAETPSEVPLPVSEAVKPESTEIVQEAPEKSQNNNEAEQG